MLQEDCEARDALDSITDELERIHADSSVDSTERWLYTTFSESWSFSHACTSYMYVYT